MISKAASTNYFVAKKKKERYLGLDKGSDRCYSEAGFQTCLQYHCVCLHGHQYEFLTHSFQSLHDMFMLTIYTCMSGWS